MSTAPALQAWAVLRATRRGLRRDRRRSIPLEDRIFPWYLAAIVFGYVVIVLAGLGDLGVGSTRLARTASAEAASRCLGALLAALAAGTVAIVAAGAVDGGPVALPAEELRVLLPTPIPRAVIIRRALLAAQARALAMAVVAVALTVLVEVALLGQVFGDCLPTVTVVALCVALSAVSAGWLIESTHVGRIVGRVVSGLVIAALLAVAVSVARAVGTHGQLAAWARLRQLGDEPVARTLTRGLQPGAPSSRTVTLLVVLIVVTAVLALLAQVRAGQVTAERIVARSGRAAALRIALLLGLTSSAYVMRTAASRLRRRRRWAPMNAGSPGRALLAKAWLQEQGTPIALRVLLAAVVATVLEAGLFSHTHQRTIAPVQLGAAAAGLLLAVAATRFADPLRVDVELSTPASSLPVHYRTVAGAAMAAPAVTFAVGGALGAVLAATLGLQPWSALGDLLLFGVLLGPLAASVATLSATANSPSPFLTPGMQLAFRLRGVIAALAAMTALAFTLHPVGRHPVTGDLRPAGIIVLAVLDAILWTAAAALGAKALRQAR